MKKKKYLITILALVAVLLLAYFAAVPYSFSVSMKLNTHPGDVIGTLRIWSRSLKGSRISEVDSFNSVLQHLEVDGRKYTYLWKFSRPNDSTTRVTVRMSEPGHDLLNKLLVPFGVPSIEEEGTRLMHEFHQVITSHLSITRVKIIGEAVLSETFCVCRRISTDQIEKANGMMKDFLPLSVFVSDNNLVPEGPPSVRVVEWNHSLGKLVFDFCFPIKETNSLPTTDIFEYKRFPRTKALKAEYFGNYITSDRAWYELIHHAERHDVARTGMPVEIFHDNPNLGLNESRWKAEIYMPIN